MEKKNKNDWKKTSWLMSDSFLKRAFAIYGYSLVAGLIIMGTFYLILFIILFLVEVTI